VKDPNTGEPLEMRIGIHIGNIIGGVIGKTTLRYDIWGPDVMTANELESNSLPKCTLVSEDVKNVIQSASDITCTFHKNLNLTGIASINTYLANIDPHNSSPEHRA